MREILAPAGDKETAMIAVNHGADAVYVGYSSFSARASAVNCSEEELSEVIRYAHIFGAKVYVAMNTMVKDAELDAYVSAFLTLHSLGADAIIMQDLFLGKYLHSQYPEVCLHLSTQAGVNNLDGARLAKECGFSRVILARETPISEIKQIASFMETEVFVQGALCSSYSGQCYFSGFVGGNSGNRGRCKQPCRKKYTYLDWTREKEGYVLSPADLCVGERIHELIEAGVTSFKIEGRMRRSEYVASAVRYYRDLLDGRDAREDFHALQRSYNRGDYTKGLAFGQDGRFLSDQTQGHIGERIGSVVRVGQTVLCQSRERGREGDGYKILREGREVAGGVFVANTKGGLEIKVNGKVRPGDEVRITTDTSLSALNELTRRIPLPMRILFREGECPVAVWKDLRIEGDCPILTAISRPIGEEEIRSCFQKTDLYPFAPELTVTVEGKGFLPKADLNAFRRKVFSAIASSFTPKRRHYERQPLPEIEKSAEHRRLCMVIGSAESLAAISPLAEERRVDVAVYKPFDYADEREAEAFLHCARELSARTALWIPGFYTDADRALLVGRLAAFDLVYTDGIGGICLARECGKEIVLGTGFSIANRIQVQEAQAYSAFVLSKELSFAEQRPIAKEGYVLTSGSIKLMDFIYCPFGKRCFECNQRRFYRLKDEEGRVFLLRRYRLSSCRFELYNCADLASVQNFAGELVDLSAISDAKALLSAESADDLKRALSSYTSGHSVHSVL